jgi:Na+/H+ antiporter NhaC
MKILRVLLFLFLLLPLGFSGQDDLDFTKENTTIIFPEIIVEGVEQNIVIELTDREIAKQLEGQIFTVFINKQKTEGELFHGKIEIPYNFPEKENLSVSVGTYTQTKETNPIPLWFSILPPLIAIFFALMFREVYSALTAGIWIGTGVIFYYQGVGFFSAIFKGFLAIIDTYILQSLNDGGHLSIILFSMIIAATVSLITKNGGMRGVVNSLSKYATGPRSGALITWALGIMVFFDDYANTLVVGNTMRPLTDKLRISREKLSYIIDSTAAPVASIAFVTTWIGAELSYIQDGIKTLGLDESAYGVFFGSLAYSFYPFFTLAFIFILIWKGLDFGPMLKAEARARQGLPSVGTLIKELDAAHLEETTEAKGVKPRMMNAVIPVLVIVTGTMTALVYTGWNQAVWDDNSLGFFEKLSETIGGADSYISLLWASFASLLVALALTLSQGLLNLRASMDSIVSGFKTMLPAVMIMTLAWSVALVTQNLRTADFISNLLLDAAVSPYLLPSITFLMAALVSFSTGSSWGTMAILYPLILPAGWIVAKSSGLDYDSSMAIFHNIAAAVLTGSVLGDHCSPISDTTILSSLASSCPHIEHVRTQLPYALATGVISILIGSLPAAYGVSSWILFPVGLIVIYFVIHFLGKNSETYPVS